MRTRDWVLLSILTLVAITCVRLGIWQLERREERISHNEWIRSQLSQPITTLTDEKIPSHELEYRRTEISGAFQNEHTVILRNRSHNDQPGVHVVTPLIISDSDDAVLVDRGWISNEAYIEDGIKPYAEDRTIEMVGIIKLSQPEPTIPFLADPTRAPGGAPILEWRVLNVEGLQAQTPFELLPFFIELEESNLETDTMPIPDPEIDLSQGPHLSYAIQWFGFTGVALLAGAAWWRRRQPRRDENADESSNS